MNGKFFCRRGQIFFMLLFFLGVIVFGQDKQVNDDKDKKLREEILAVYKAGGEKGLQDYLEKNKNKITDKFIGDFAIAGFRERKKGWLNVCKILSEKKKNEKALAYVILKTGEYFSVISDFKKAHHYYNESLSIYQRLNDPVGQGNVYLSKGDIYLYTGNNSKAIETYEKAMMFYEKAKYPQGQGNIYLRKGTTYFYIGENLKALDMYEKALPLFEKIGDIVGQGNLYQRMAEISFYTGDNLKALEMYDKALSFFKNARSSTGQGNVYFSKGDIYLTIGENSNAIKMYDKALPFYKKAVDAIGQSNVYLRKGDTYFYTGYNSKAIQMYNKALILYEKSEDLIGQGNTYKSIGNIYSRVGEYLKAIDMYDKALLFFEKAREPVSQGNVYRSKGDIYLIIDETLKANEMYDKALPFFKKNGEPIGLGNVYRGKGDYYLYTGNNSQAIEMYNNALSYFLEAGELNGQGNVYLRMEAIYLEIDDISKALEMCNKALAIFKKTEDIGMESISFHIKAKILVKLGKKAEALALFNNGIALLEKVRTQTAFSEMKKSFMEKVYKQYEETVLFMLENKYYDKGFQYAESMKSRVFLDRMAEELVRLEKGLKSDLKEKRDNMVAKLSSLNKQIYEAAGGKDEEKLEKLKEQYRETGDEFEELLIKIRLENPLYASVRYPQPISVHELQKEVLKKGEILVRYFISLDKLYVFLISKKKFKVVALDVKKQEIKGDVQQYLSAFKDNDSLRLKRYGKMLYEKLFKPLEKRIKKSKEIIIVPDGELATIPFESLIVDNKGQDHPVFLLEKYRVKYLQSASLLKILRLHYQNNRETNSFIGFGDPVYDYENFKQGKPEHGSTEISATESKEVTESVFSQEDTRSDTKEKSLSSDPSVSSVAKASPQAFGDEIKEIHRDRYARAGGIMDRLEASGEEVKTIARLFEKKSQNSVIHLREEATEDNAGSPGMKDFDYIHFTCHGLLNDDFQSLVLSQLPPDKGKEDGYFTLNEIMNCDYNAKLVVLSACQTGSGKLERAEGVTGMTRAVMYAGTPAVAASLWKVDDEATKELMVKFYENMLEKNLDKAEALRQAKLELIKNKKYRSPLFWSAFIMYGE